MQLNLDYLMDQLNNSNLIIRFTIDRMTTGNPFPVWSFSLSPGRVRARVQQFERQTYVFVLFFFGNVFTFLWLMEKHDGGDGAIRELWLRHILMK